MPSKKNRSQRVAVKAQQVLLREAALSNSMNFDAQDQLNIQGTDKAHGLQAPQGTFAQAAGKNGSQAQRRSSSQKSVSTDEGGSSQSGGSESSPARSDSPAAFPAFNEQEPSAMRTESPRQPLRDLNAQIQGSHAPLWVSNNAKGDTAAWLLVLPKFSPVIGDSPSIASAQAPKSPNDVIFLGPYVTTKNTFLEESRVGGVLSDRQRPRAKSVGACCYGLP